MTTRRPPTIAYQSQCCFSPALVWKKPGCSSKNLNVTNLGVDRALFGLLKILAKTETSEFEPKMELRAFFFMIVSSGAATFRQEHPKWDQNPSDLYLYLYLI